MARYRKKPVVIDAYQTDVDLDIPTLEGTMHASAGDWIITGVQGERYPCKPAIFESTYEVADVGPQLFHVVIDAQFTADALDNALIRLGSHFIEVAEKGDAAEPFFRPNSEVDIHLARDCPDEEEDPAC
jgi:hypothetical protein